MNNQLKQYTGTKTVKARPMTMGEAYECKLLKEGVIPSECETDKAGYLVEYEDGYKSWSPKNVFDAAYKLSETFLDRLVNEYEEICNRGEKCGDFIESDNFEKLGYTARILLAAQDMIMYRYETLLLNRIDAAKGGNLCMPFDFGTAVNVLKAGGAINRRAWRSEKFVIKQVPSHITADIIPKMQSLPQVAKDILMSRKDPHIDYINQMLIVHSDGHVDSWHPTPEDIFAEDWRLVIPPIKQVNHQ